MQSQLSGYVHFTSVLRLGPPAKEYHFTYRSLLYYSFHVGVGAFTAYRNTARKRRAVQTTRRAGEVFLEGFFTPVDFFYSDQIRLSTVIYQSAEVLSPGR